MDAITIANDGPRIASTPYWSSTHAARGVIYVSVNAGAFRVLVPPVAEGAILPELRTACDVVISRGPWPDQRRADAIEILWDDGSDNPFALHLSIEQIDRVPDAADEGRHDLTCTVWTAGPEGAAVERGTWPCTYRRSRRLPDLRPAKEA